MSKEPERNGMIRHMDRGAVKLAPWILNADFARLGDQVVEAERAGADLWIDCNG
jgi:hypothetical protein